MDDLINQIKQGGVKLKSTKPFSLGCPNKKTDPEVKEKPVDAVQEMKSILATMKRARHGRLKPSAISQESKSRTTKGKKEKIDSISSDKTTSVEETRQSVGVDPNSVVVEGFSTPQTKENSPVTDMNSKEESMTSKDENTNLFEHYKTVEDTTSANIRTTKNNAIKDISRVRNTTTPSEDITSASASYTLKLINTCHGENECSSRETTPPITGRSEKSEERENSRPSPARAISSTTIFLRSSRSPSQE